MNNALKRAEVIMKVRCGLLTATEAAKQLEKDNDLLTRKMALQEVLADLMQSGVSRTKKK